MPRRFARHASLVALGGLLCATGLPSLARAATPRAVVADALAVPARDTIVATPISTSFDVVLRQSHPRALSALLGALSDPTSAQYRHFLTTAQFAQRFGATPRALDAVRTYLAGYGLRVGSLSRGRVVLRVRGTTPQIAAAFDAPVATVRTRDGRLRAQLTAPATMPVALAHLVAGVTGLSSVASTTPALAKTRRLTSATTPGTCPSAGSSAGPTRWAATRSNSRVSSTACPPSGAGATSARARRSASTSSPRTRRPTSPPTSRATPSRRA